MSIDPELPDFDPDYDFVLEPDFDDDEEYRYVAGAARDLE